MQLTLNSKITIIIGESATGKSSIHKLMAVKNAKVVKKCSDPGFKFVHLDNEESMTAYLLDKDDVLNDRSRLLPRKVYIIDENDLRINDTIASIIKKTINSYFIIISRSNLSSLNYSINDVKVLETGENGVVVLKNYLNTKKMVNLSNLELDKYVIEDRGKAKEWFKRLLNNNKDIIVAGSTDESGNVDKAKDKDSGGKEKVCNEVEKQILNGSKHVLVIFDSCSFGSCIVELKSLLSRYPKEVFLLSNYKSWEYVILKSNLFENDSVKEYSLNEPVFEESFYEIELQKLTDGDFTTIRHDKGMLSKCYTDKCCAYKRKGICNLGLPGEDKFVALLSGTLFEDLLRLSRRI